MIRTSSKNSPRQSWLLLAFASIVTCFLAGCATTGSSTSDYHAVAYAPTDPSKVIVKVSLKSQMVYVMEGDNCLMVTPTCVGKPGYPTPEGRFKVMAKIADKRSSTYGYWVRGSEAHPGASANPPAGGGWHYVGYPMAYWIEFAPGYGFHEGPVWPYPRSHGCLHLHITASAKFYQLVKVGTPVDIAQTHPEDAVYGRNAGHPTDYADPDPAPSLMIGPEFFSAPREKELLPPKTSATPPPS